MHAQDRLRDTPEKTLDVFVTIQTSSTSVSLLLLMISGVRERTSPPTVMIAIAEDLTEDMIEDEGHFLLWI